MALQMNDNMSGLVLSSPVQGKVGSGVGLGIRGPVEQGVRINFQEQEQRGPQAKSWVCRAVGGVHACLHRICKTCP